MMLLPTAAFCGAPSTPVAACPAALPHSAYFCRWCPLPARRRTPCARGRRPAPAIAAAAFAAATVPASPNLLSVPVDYYKLLQLTRLSTSQACKRAYEVLLGSPPALGLSAATIANRERVLGQAALFLLDPETRKLYDATMLSGAGEAEVEYDDLPGVFCLLYESGELRLVVEWAKGWLGDHAGDARARDVAVLAAHACWDAAVAVLKEEPEDVVGASDVLAEGLALLEAHKASPELRQRITAALEELAPSVALKLVGLPLEPEYAELRAQGLAVLRAVFEDEPQHYFATPHELSTYLTAVRKQLTVSEQASVLSAFPLGDGSSVEEVYEVALGYCAEGCRTRSPALVKKAAELLERYAPKVYAEATEGAIHPLDVTVGRAVCQLLLGRRDRAAAILGLDGSVEADPGVLNFILDNSPPGSGDVEPGLRLLTQRWLEDIAFSTCRASAPAGPFSLDDWLEDRQVKLHNAVLEAPAPLAQLAGAVAGGAGKVAALFGGSKRADGRGPPSPAVGFDEEEGPAAVGRGVPPLDGQEQLLATAGAQRQQGKGGRALPALAAMALILAAAAGARSVLQSGSISCPTPSLPTLSLPKLTLPTLPLPELTLPKLPATQRAAPAASPSGKQPDAAPAAPARSASTAVASSSSKAALSAEEAHALVREWQVVKAEALGPRHAARKLGRVLTGSMLKQWKQRAADVKSSGWHWEYQLNDMRITGVKDASGGSGKGPVTVGASFNEVACIVENGAVQESYANKYSIEYDLVKEGSRWKIASGHILDY